MTDRELDELHGGRELLPIEQEIYEQEGAERFVKHHPRLATMQASQRVAQNKGGEVMDAIQHTRKGVWSEAQIEFLLSNAGYFSVPDIAASIGKGQ